MKTVFITGASSGIGKSTSLLLLRKLLPDAAFMWLVKRKFRI